MDTKNLSYEDLFKMYQKQNHRLEKIISVSDKQAKQLFELSSKLDKLSSTDSLTGIFNRRYLFEISKKIIAVSKREDKDISLAIIDIDNFKKINDTFGHYIGDQVIISFVNTIRNSIRKNDIFARLGGDEFIVLFQDTSLENALIICEKVKLAIAKEEIDKETMYTISIGVSQLDLSSEDIMNEALKKADNALYKSKKYGRNQINYVTNLL